MISSSQDRENGSLKSQSNSSKNYSILIISKKYIRNKGGSECQCYRSTVSREFRLSSGSQDQTGSDIHLLKFNSIRINPRTSHFKEFEKVMKSTKKMKRLHASFLPLVTIYFLLLSKRAISFSGID